MKALSLRRTGRLNKDRVRRILGARRHEHCCTAPCITSPEISPAAAGSFLAKLRRPLRSGAISRYAAFPGFRRSLPRIRPGVGPANSPLPLRQRCGVLEAPYGRVNAACDVEDSFVTAVCHHDPPALPSIRYLSIGAPSACLIFCVPTSFVCLSVDAPRYPLFAQTGALPGTTDGATA